MAVLAVALLPFISDEDDPAGIISRLTAPLVAGSYLALSHGTNDGQQDWTEFRAIYGRAGIEGTLRTRAQVEALFGDFELVEPGVVWIPLWRPESPDDVFYEDPESSAIYAAVGRKR